MINNRLNTSSISVSSDGGQVNDSGAMLTNGSAVGVPTHLVHPHQHPPNYGYPHFSHHAPAAAFIQPFNSPVYFIPEIQYFPPNMTIPPNHQNVITSPNSFIDITPLSNNFPSTSLATTAPSNLSSSVSASSSIAIAYHSSQSSQSDTSSFDHTDESNIRINSLDISPIHNDDALNNNVENVNDSRVAIETIKQVPLHPDLSPNVQQSVERIKYQSSFPLLESHAQSEINNSQNYCTHDNDLMNKISLTDKTEKSEVKNDISNSQISSEANHLFSSIAQTSQNIDVSKLNNQSLSFNNDEISSTLETVSNNSSGPTWASKLFGSTTNSDPNQNKSITMNKTTPDLSENITKSDITNGDFPELNNSKSLNQINNRTYKNRLSNLNVEDISKIKIIPIKEDSVALNLAKKLRDSIQLKHSLPTIMPCGLVNRGNWCYVNAVSVNVLSHYFISLIIYF